MILVTHGTVGGVLGRFAPNPWVALLTGILSHFVLDSVKHWQYRLKSKTYAENGIDSDMALDGRFLWDLTAAGIDALSGVALPLVFLPGNEWAVFAGAVGGILPDFLQFVYFKVRRQPLVSIQRFHNWIHAKTDFDYKSIPGMLIQAGIIVASILIARAVIFGTI